MKMSVLAVSVVLALAASSSFAHPPAKNVNHHRHPNLAAAQHLTAQAYNRIVDAQKANEFDLGGHAKRAEELLDQANHELKEAAQTANANHH